MWIASDSTAADYPLESLPMMGWGQSLGRYFNEKVIICNEAVNGRSSKSFIHEGCLTRIEDEIRSNDYLLIQFGHNDAKPDEERHTEAEGDYAEYIQRYIDAADRVGAIPVLITSLERRHVDEYGAFIPTHGAYPETIRRIAADQQLALIDLCAKSTELYHVSGRRCRSSCSPGLLQGSTRIIRMACRITPTCVSTGRPSSLVSWRRESGNAVSSLPII